MEALCKKSFRLLVHSCELYRARVALLTNVLLTCLSFAHGKTLSGFIKYNHIATLQALPQSLAWRSSAEHGRSLAVATRRRCRMRP